MNDSYIIKLNNVHFWYDVCGKKALEMFEILDT